MTLEKNRLMGKLYLGFFVFLAVALQIQVTLFTSENYAGLRVNFADILMPIMGLTIIISLFLKKSDWPQFHIKYAYFWLAGLGAVMTLSLINGYFLYSQWNQWGLTNKLVGWFVLSGYFLLGGWLTYNSPKDYLLIFIKIFVYFFTLLITITSLMMVLQFYKVSYDFYKLVLPIEGFMANKNSFIFLTLSILALTTCFQKILFPNWLIFLLWFLMPFIFIYTGARAGLIAFPFICITLSILMKPELLWKKICLSLIAGIFFIALVQNTSKTNIFKLYDVTAATTISVKNLAQGASLKEIKEKVDFKGDAFRLKALDTTKNMIMARPILGSGLGSAEIEQEKQWGRFYAIIDCTPLWLWAETGLVGLCLFLVFYFICFKQLWKSATTPNTDEDDVSRALNQSVLITLITFAIMCLFHELLYTRFLWFFMGLALAYPLKSRQTKQ